MLLPQNDDKSFKRKREHLCMDSDRAANADHGDVSLKSDACL